MLDSVHRDAAITPGELEMLHGLLRSICRDKSVDVQSAKGESMAAQLIAHFQRGARDEVSLVEAMDAA
ncbi:hypothetical protein QO002_002874 [Pararhizobium capsulatum DSM 1112]|uniref:Uncharacterized protein n=1 Tax=Pararhizobium capsulatum DSM 1112 TaxID=1121113 RepID=A0ABU0BSV5_9HYPH|nr:hypothetical protein [Pararhizobium capsulatum]MDQ0320736.1 hypothetical protein [Pararhizobium capsulatum DSM 1112]